MLKKHHKYTLNKQRIKALKALAARFQLPYDAKTLRGYLELTVFEEGLRNKQFIESFHEQVRNQCFDFWDYLSFNERNDLILRELEPELLHSKHFIHKEALIFIPFFDELMNTLYAKEVAILELPQFFNLYREFTDKLIHINHYGLQPFAANMSEFWCCYSDDMKTILHDDHGKAFIVVESDSAQVYPYLKTKGFTEPVIKALATLLAQNIDGFYQGLIDAEAVSKRFVKRYKKKVKS